MKTMLKATEIVRILKACEKAGVSEIEIGALKAKFRAPGPEIQKEVQLPLPIVVSEEVQNEIAEESGEALIKENLDNIEERLDLLQIEDPVLYERLLIERELEDNAGPRAH